jgi:tRNA 2-selenouridine synthase
MINFINDIIHNPNFTFIDVRSEDEFSDGHLPGALNIPILINEHRKLVGTCYKEKGQNEAIQLGHRLVGPLKKDYLEKWKKALEQNPEQRKYVHCWRGGLRSKLTQKWIQEMGLQVELVEGGYKAVRNHLLLNFEADYHLIVVSGLTGTGKSRLLEKLNQKNVIDLEKYANHRGSAFGHFHKRTQSSQQYFENQLALKLYEKQFVYAVEHESRFVGKNIIPPHFFSQINKAPQIILTAPINERVESIYKEYVKTEINDLNKESIKGLKNKMMTSLKQISKKLGGVLYKEIESDMGNAFSDFGDCEKHYVWIKKLLEVYYDKLYSYSQKSHKDQQCIFQGNIIECEEFLQSYISRRGTL